jgi:CubicO group peptidase (beta-lactamase class C family)
MILKRIVPLVLLVSLPIAPTRGDEPASKVDALFARWNRPDSPGAAVAVVKGGAILHIQGYGMADLEHDAPITPRTVFHVASVSKQFTAFGIALLAEQGKLALDDDIRKYLDEVPDLGPTITVRQLILHTSGLRDQWDLAQMAGWRMDDVITQAQILRLVGRQRALNFAPGTEHLYCNTGYTLLAEIVGRVGGRPFPEWMQEHVFGPLEMDRTLFYDDHERIVKDRAYSYKPGGGGRDSDGYKKDVLNYANVGATSLFTTAADLTRWLANFDEPKVGDPRVIARMCEPGKLAGGEPLTYAFGRSVERYRGLRLIGHSGGDAGYRSYVGRFPDQGLGVIVLSNLATFDPAGMAMRVAEVYLGDRMTAPQARPARLEPAGETPTAVAIDTARLNDLAGRYEAEGNGLVYSFRREGDRLLGSFPPRRRREVELLPLSDSEFFLTGSPVRVEFHRDEAGKVTHVTFRPRDTVARRLEVFAPSAPELAAYAGRYSSPELETAYRLVVKDGNLVAEHARHDETALTPFQKDRFTNDLLGRVVFDRDADGRVTGFRATTGRVRNLRFERRD